MSQASGLSPELARGLLQLARALVVAARNWMLYPPEHPTVGVSVARLCDAIRESSLGAVFSIGITPDTLMIESAAADPTQTGIAEAAALLHDRDLLHITFSDDVSPEAIHALLRLLALDATERRRRGGPARIWATEGHPALALQQIDYDKVLARERGEVPEAAGRDNLWRSIVMSIAGGQQTTFDEREQQRLLAMADNPADIANFAGAVMESKCAADGSAMITSQAAAVLAAFRHLRDIVSVMAPERIPDLMRNLADAATRIDPHVVMQLLQAEEDPTIGVSMVADLTGAFDDAKVAQLLATALALEGRVSDRLATIFNTIAPDDDRKRRVLTITRSLLSETDLGKSEQFRALWTSMEELLVSYDDNPFVSPAYRAALDGVSVRAERLAADLPGELPAWMESLGQANVRSLSVTMLMDLFALERDEARGVETVEDMEALAQDLLMAGAYDDTLRVTSALAERAKSRDGLARDACRLALDRLGESAALRETTSVVDEIGAPTWTTIRAVVETIGVASVEALKPLLIVEHESVGSGRAQDVIVGFGGPAVSRLASLLDDSRWFVQQNGARLLGRIGSPDAVPLLQPLLRRSNPPVVRAAVSALARIDSPTAARAVHTVLRAATGVVRQAVIEALVADRDPRVVPMLLRIVQESTPLGRDHDVVLETLSALGTVGGDRAVPTLAAMAERRAFFRRKRLRALKERSVDALVRIGTPTADAVMRQAARSGDRILRKIVAARWTS